MTTNDQRPLVLQCEDLHPEAAAWLAQRARLEQRHPDDDAFQNQLSNARALLVRTYTTVDNQLLRHAPDLQVVGRAGVGLDNIDVQACLQRGVQVVHTPDANTQAVVELVFRTILAHLRPLTPLTEPLKPAEWAERRANAIGIRQLNECTLGILGLGRIGKRVAAVGAAFGCRVQYFDLLDIPEQRRAGATSVGFEELLATSDVLTIHIDGRASNRHLISANELGTLRENALLLNIARGFIIDAKDLAAHAATHPAFHAILDVHEEEPITASTPYLKFPNVTSLAHVGARTAAALRAMSDVVRDVDAVLQGRTPQFPAASDLHS